LHWLRATRAATKLPLRLATLPLLRLRLLPLRTLALLHRALPLRAMLLPPLRVLPLLLRTLLLRLLRPLPLRLRAQASKLLPATRQQKTGLEPVFCFLRETIVKHRRAHHAALPCNH
jgi:hypothetical protein